MMGARSPEALAHDLDKALGTAWDDELEPTGTPATARP